MRRQHRWRRSTPPSPRLSKELGRARLHRPRDRLFGQERASRPVRRYLDRQFPDDHEHLGLFVRRGRPARGADDEAGRGDADPDLLRRGEGHPALQRHGRGQGRARDQRQISRRRPRPRRDPGQCDQRGADQDARGQRHRRLPLHHEVERI